MSTVTDEGIRISNLSGLEHSRVVTAFEQFRERNGGDSRAAVRAIEWLATAYNGDPVRTGLELHRQAHRPVDGRELRLRLPAFDETTAPHEDEYGEYRLDIRGWSGLDERTPVIWRHRGQPVADVVGWRQLPNSDLDVWVRLRDGQDQIRAAALWSELSCSPGIRVGDDDGEWTGRPSDRVRIVQRAALREVSLTEAGLNRLPKASVSCEPCPADARPPVQTRGNYTYTDRRTGEPMYVRTFPSSRITSVQ